MRCHFEKLSFFAGEVSLGLGTKDFQRIDKVLCHLRLHVEFVRDWVLHDPQGNHRLAGQGLHQQFKRSRGNVLRLARHRSGFFLNQVAKLAIETPVQRAYFQ